MENIEAKENCPYDNYAEGIPSGECESNGHYLCQDCKHFRADFLEHGMLSDYVQQRVCPQRGILFIVIKR